jgi:hypothetical protein
MLLRIMMALVGMYLILLAWGVNVTGLSRIRPVSPAWRFFFRRPGYARQSCWPVCDSIDQPYRIDDYIVIDTGERGRVTHTACAARVFDPR